MDHPQIDPFAEGVWGYHTGQPTKKKGKSHQGKSKTKEIGTEKLKQKTKKISKTLRSHKQRENIQTKVHEVGWAFAAHISLF